MAKYTKLINEISRVEINGLENFKIVTTKTYYSTIREAETKPNMELMENVTYSLPRYYFEAGANTVKVLFRRIKVTPNGIFLSYEYDLHDPSTNVGYFRTLQEFEEFISENDNEIFRV